MLKEINNEEALKILSNPNNKKKYFYNGKLYEIEDTITSTRTILEKKKTEKNKNDVETIEDTSYVIITNKDLDN